MVHHGLLDGSQLAVLREGFHSVDFLASGHGKEHQAAIDRGVGAARAILPDHHHGTGAAFAFGTAFFGAGKPARAYKVQKRRMEIGFGLHTLAIENKFDRAQAGLMVG